MRGIHATPAMGDLTPGKGLATRMNTAFECPSGVTRDRKPVSNFTLYTDILQQASLIQQAGSERNAPFVMPPRPSAMPRCLLVAHESKTRRKRVKMYEKNDHAHDVSVVIIRVNFRRYLYSSLLHSSRPRAQPTFNCGRLIFCR